MIKEQNRRMQLEQIKKQMAEKKDERSALAWKERAEHVRDLDLQNQMHERRQQGLNEHLQSIKDRDDSINKHFEVSQIELS